MDDEFQKYLVAVEDNRASFRRDHPAVFKAFEVSTRAFERLGKQLTTSRDGEGASHVSLAPLYLILQRQSMAAFQSVAGYQAFLGWSTVRTGVEAALMMGKWVDDPSNATTWANHQKDWRAYARLFQGKALRSEALPHSSQIQGALSRINDLFLHPNPAYYFRHLSLDDREDDAVEMNLNFFDARVDAAVGILGILHLVVFVQDAISRMFADLFHGAPIDVGLASLERMAGDWARDTMLESAEARTHMVELGLWPDVTAL